MLRFTDTKSAIDAKGYYLAPSSDPGSPGASHRLADYYDAGEGQGVWHGKGAHRLSLTGSITQEAFERLCDNLHPRPRKQDGSQLTPKTKQGRRVGTDLTFNAPKSLSLLWAHTNDPRLLQALQASVKTTLDHLEPQAACRVRKGGQDTDRLTGELTAALFTHKTSRPTLDNPEPDPHLHVHAFVFNHTWDPQERKFKAIQLGRVRGETELYEAVFHSELAKRVQDLGYPIRRTSGVSGWEFAAIDRPMIERFSKRTAEINRLAQEKGIADSRTKASLGAKTRRRKAKRLTLKDLRASWLSSFTFDEHHRLIHAQEVPNAPTITPKQAMDAASSHVFERETAVRRAKLLAAALKAGIGEHRIDAIAKAFRGRAWLMAEDDLDRTIVTTPGLYDEERSMLSFAREGRGAYLPLGDLDRVATPGGGVELSDEQKAAVHHVWRSQDRVTAITGRAGVGKTTLMREAINGLEAAGHEVAVLAPSVTASRGVLRDEGFQQANTIASFLKQHEQGPKEPFQGAAGGTPPPSVIWIDEASLVGTRTMSSLFAIAERLNARVVLSGDSRQHGSVQRGDALRLLETHAGIRPAKVQTIRRQRGDYQKAIQHLSQSDPLKGFDQLMSMKAVKQLPHEHRYTELAKDYADARGTKLIVAPTHAEGQKVTEAVRDHLKQLGTLDNKEHQLPYHRNLQWTHAQKQDPQLYEPGLKIRTHTPMKDIPPGSWLTVTTNHHGKSVTVTNDQNQTIDLNLDHADRFTTHAPEQIKLAQGDLVRTTQSLKSLGGQRINNGQLYRIDGLTRSGELQLSSLTTTKTGKPRSTIRLPRDNASLTHGYCTTSHASQGRTVDHVFIAQGSESLPATGLEQLYVSASRGKHSCRLYTDDTNQLREAIQRSHTRLSAVELAQQPTGRMHRPEVTRQRRVARLLAQWRDKTRQAYDRMQRGRSYDPPRRRMTERGMSHELRR